MRIIATVAVVAFCAVLQILSVRGSLETQLDAVNAGIVEVQETMARLRSLQYVRVFKPMLDAIQNAGKNASDAINIHYNETFDIIQIASNNLTAEGKDATGCVEAARNGLQAVRTTAMTGVDGCFDTVRNILNETETKLDGNMEDAVLVLSFLNSVFSTCYVPNVEKIESCVDQLLPNATQMVERYRAITVTLLENVDLTERVQTEFMGCLNQLGGTVVPEWTSVETDFKKCIEAL